MAVERWDPVRDLRHLKEKVDTLFRDVLGRAGSEAAPELQGAWRPPVDVWEEGDSYQIRADLPGVAAADVTVEIEGGVLLIRGERRTGAPVPTEDFLRAERPCGRFALSMAARFGRSSRGRCEAEGRRAGDLAAHEARRRQRARARSAEVGRLLRPGSPC
jgi:HSP20 family molecular chaperone IbpA